MPTVEQFTQLMAFRQAAYEILGPARDALFELTDAVMLTPSIQSFAELALCPAFRRQWSSVYEALQDGRPDRTGLLQLYSAHLPVLEQPLLVGDHTSWPRLGAATLRDRGFVHHPTPIRGNKPITVGHQYSTLAWIPPEQTGWAVPLLHERIPTSATPMETAAAQLRQVCAQLPGRPLGLWDSEYGCAPFLQAIADIPADHLIRLRPNRKLYGPPPPYRGWGRPRVHGAKFKLADPRTWPEPVETMQLTDPKWGPVTVQRWNALHLKEAPQSSLVVLRIHRLEAKNTRREPQDLWLGWVGLPPPPLAEWWNRYGRRVLIEAWYRLAKGRLHWTVPHLKTPEQSQGWSDLMPLLSWQLWLARPLVADTRLPWQKPQPHPTPQRVLQGMGGLLTQIGTPTRWPKPRGKSPGWPRGRLRQRAERYEVVKKRA